MNRDNIRLLLVEDNADDALILEESVAEINSGELYGCRFDVDRVESLAAAKVWLESHEPDVVLLDLSLPDSTGIETVYKFEPYLSETPVVILTGLTDSTAAVTSIRQGIQDYLVKGMITPDSLFRSVVYSVERHKMVTMIQGLAMVDELTGLYNRRGFMKLARHNMNLAKRKSYSISLLFADLDNMKIINDRFGHKEGDRALKMTAQVLRQSFRESDIAARIGGDEFVVMSSGSTLCCDDIIKTRIEKNIAEVSRAEPHEFDFSVSFGVINPESGDNLHIEQLLEMADGRMYDEKNRKRGGLR